MSWKSSIKLDIAQTLFCPVGITIVKNEKLDFYECSGFVTGKNRTLTGLCIAIVGALKDGQITLEET